MPDIVIKIENLSKQYRLGQIGTGTLRDDLNRFWAKIRGKEDPTLKIGQANILKNKNSDNKELLSEYIWALKDINFEVEKGNVLGIIGKNGAGKSTLLKILSKVTSPTTGSVRVKGRIASLLEVGTGFHPELSGRENIFLNGAILGMTKAEIRAKLDEIVDFAGVAKYIDTPVKRYSSGMYVRLAFAVAAHLEPEILVVDEVLAVGDAEFQKKALGKMQNISKGQGRTVLFVSHNMTAIETLCQKVIVLKNGNINFSGKAEEGIFKYLENDGSGKNYLIKDGISYLHNDLSIFDVQINGSNSNMVYIDENSDSIDFNLTGNLSVKKRMALEIRIFDFRENLLAFFSPGHLYGELKTYEAGRFEIIEKIKMPANISKGEYFISFLVSHPNVESYVVSHKHVKLISRGVKTTTGFELEYKNRGFIILERKS